MEQVKKAAIGKRVLLVDDEEELRVLVGGYLQDMGMEVIFAADGKIAQNIAGVQELDLVISDVVMPVCNGIELLQGETDIVDRCPF